ncbi:MAG: hypothetical protein ACYTEL_15650 [Planctomycetota bacterium]|jgi:hypothetical protein
MSRTVFALLPLLMAAPVMADVVILVSAGPGPNDVTISYDASSEANLVRAFALDIVIEDVCAIVVDVNCVSADYHVYPGGISIDSGGVVTDWSTCKCSEYAGTLDEPNAVTIEMGSVYIGAANAPASSGDLAILTLGGCDNDGDVTLTISENILRGGVVMEDSEQEVTVDSPGGTVPTSLDTCVVATCWDGTQCAGQPYGDATCDGDVGIVNLADLFALKAHFGKSAPWTGAECCADFTHDGSINLADLYVLKTHFGTSGYSPSTGNQNCQP